MFNLDHVSVTEAYLRHCQSCMMDFFSKNSCRLKTVKYFDTRNLSDIH